jgi:hypothetical protein
MLACVRNRKCERKARCERRGNWQGVGCDGESERSAITLSVLAPTLELALISVRATALDEDIVCIRIRARAVPCTLALALGLVLIVKVGGIVAGGVGVE